MKLSLPTYFTAMVTAVLAVTACTPEQDDGISPERQFVKYYGRNGLDVGVDIRYTPADGGLVVLGQRDVIGEIDNSIVLYKMDSAGNVLQENEIGRRDGFTYTPKKIVIDPTGGFVIGGTRTDIDLQSFMFTMHVAEDLSLTPTWGEGGFQLYGRDIIEFEFENNAITRTPNHRLFDLTVDETGFAILGSTNDVDTIKFAFDPATDASDVSVYLLGAQGEVLLSRTYGYVGRDEGHSIIPTGNNEYAIMGMTNRSAFGGNDTQLSGNNILFNLIDGNGQLRQNKIYGSTSGEGNIDVDDAPVVMVQDGLGFAGMANDGASNAIMIRLTSTGELIALQNLDLTISGQNSLSTSLIRTFRGDYIVTGSVNTLADTETAVDRGTDMLVLNVNQDFTVNTNRVYNYGGEEDDISNGIVQLPSSNLVILGTTDFENGNTMITLMKTNATGRFIGN